MDRKVAMSLSAILASPTSGARSVGKAMRTIAVPIRDVAFSAAGLRILGGFEVEKYPLLNFLLARSSVIPFFFLSLVFSLLRTFFSGPLFAPRRVKLGRSHVT
jgi:hypothetical protein